MALVENVTKRKLKANELALGFGVHHLRTSATAMLASAADHDWLFIDTEHGALSVHEVTQICLASLPTGVTPIVRVCAGALDEGTRALDNGALGVVVPHVDTAERAKELVRAFRYRQVRPTFPVAGTVVAATVLVVSLAYPGLLGPIYWAYKAEPPRSTYPTRPATTAKKSLNF